MKWWLHERVNFGYTEAGLKTLQSDVARVRAAQAEKAAQKAANSSQGGGVAKSAYKKIRKLIKPYRVTNGKKFRLKDVDPDDTGGLKSRSRARPRSTSRAAWNCSPTRQARLYAQDRWSMLLIFQAMDAAGKDGVIKHVTSGIDPQGMQVYSFKAPSSEELDHDFMWRCLKALPERGRIGVFNRSYYEEVLAVRVHEAYLLKQKLPRKLITKRIWDERYQDIRAIERYLSRNGILILKFFLHVSKKEQKKRFLERLDRRTRTGSFPPPTRANASTGTTTWTRSSR
jgi:PPK2 family polyphosphate:nucleotide phosphotransferase